MASSKKNEKKKSPVAERLAGEHRTVFQAVHDLEELTARKDAAEAFSEWRDDLLPQLRSLHGLLSDHFEREQEGGFLGDVLRKVPNAQHEVETLRQEHAEIGVSLESLLADITRTESGGYPDVERFRQAIGGITSTLRRHEISEQHLFQRTYYRDYGAGD